VKKIGVDAQDLKIKAKELMKIHYPDNKFKGSNGWLHRFLKRNRISRRVCTHALQKLSENFNNEIIDLWKEIKK
jgi:hypothetical protein